MEWSENTATFLKSVSTSAAQNREVPEYIEKLIEGVDVGADVVLMC